MCLHVTAFVISFNLISNLDQILKKLNFDLLTPAPRVVGGGGGGGEGWSADLIFANMLLHGSFLSI